MARRKYRSRKKPERFTTCINRIINNLVNNIIKLFKIVAFYGLIFGIVVLFMSNTTISYKGHRIKENLKSSMKQYAVGKLIHSALDYMNF